MWIEDYRVANGLELDDLARKVNWLGRRANPPLEGVVSDTLIHILERSKVPRTHPRIANLIAEACGATAEQRDMIVDKRHWGTWEPKTVAAPTENSKIKSIYPDGRKGVVKVDRYGNILCTYPSVTDAVRHEVHHGVYIRDRCKRRAKNEFGYLGYTFRYADEWNEMSADEKLMDIGAKNGEKTSKEGT